MLQRSLASQGLETGTRALLRALSCSCWFDLTLAAQTEHAQRLCFTMLEGYPQ